MSDNIKVESMEVLSENENGTMDLLLKDSEGKNWKATGVYMTGCFLGGTNEDCLVSDGLKMDVNMKTNK